jgi:hypothetical protein
MYSKGSDLHLIAVVTKCVNNVNNHVVKQPTFCLFFRNSLNFMGQFFEKNCHFSYFLEETENVT